MWVISAGRRFILCLLLLFAWTHAPQTAAGPKTVRIGLPAKQGLAHCRVKWGPTALKEDRLVAVYRQYKGWFVRGGMAIFAVCFSAVCVAKLYAKLSRIISRLKESQLDLESALAVANQANKAKDEFLANMSHELRTPLNGIIGMAGILQGTELTDEQKESVQIIVTSSEGLLGIINDMLDDATIEAGQMKLDVSGFDLAAFIDGVVKEALPKANAKALVFTHMVDETVPACLKGDRRRLKQVIGNLLNNAVKFTHQGAVSLHAAMAEERKKDCILRFSVKDTGIGIAPERIASLFDPFSQADNSSTRGFGGTGMGLALAKHCAQLMGGHIGVESTPGKGSLFWFTVRLEKRHPPPNRKPYSSAKVNNKRISIADDLCVDYRVPADDIKTRHLPYASYGNNVQGTIDAARIRGPRVLLVEDNLINQKVVLKILTSSGCRTLVANNGREAVSALCRHAFDVVLMDIQMPEMNGFEATGAIRNPSNRCLDPQIPIIAVTANAGKEDRQLCLDAGMDDYLSKPVNPEALVEKVMQWSSCCRPDASADKALSIGVPR